MNEKKLVLKIAGSLWENASRDQRELSVVKELGADVIVMAKGDVTGKRENVNGFEVYRVTTRPLGGKVPNVINRIISLFVWAKHVNRIKPDLISGHDLIGVQVGWMANFFKPKSKKIPIIYDSHEYTVCNSGEKEWSWFKTTEITLLERFLIKRCILTMEVTDSIADEVQELHKLKERPVVVRNIPGYWNIDRNKIDENRNNLLDLLNVPADKRTNAFIFSRHGGVVSGRGIEKVIDAIGRNEEIYGLILGNGDEDYINELKNRAERVGAKERILFHPSVKLSELYKWVGATDANFVGIDALCKSYIYSLPNKFFESIQSTTPIICSDFPEMGKLCREYGLGIAINPDSENEMDNAIRKLSTDKTFKEECINNCKKAKEILCWENEKNIVEEMYRPLLQ